MSFTMATPLRHYVNLNNSCAIDSFLELAQFSFYDDLHSAAKGEFLTLIYDACRSRERTVDLPLSEVRKSPWLWLQSNATTFAGCTNSASFEQILDCILTNPDEDKLFNTTTYWHYLCTSCHLEKIEPKQNLPLYISNDRVLADCDFDLEHVINRVLYHPEDRIKTCLGCNQKTRRLSSVTADLSQYIFVRIPTVSNSAGDLDVLSGIKVKEEIILHNEYEYKLCGAVRGKNKHFSVTVKYNDGYSHIDDTSLNVRSARSLSRLTGQGDSIYETTSDDGYFLFVFKFAGKLDNCEGAPQEELASESQCFTVAGEKLKGSHKLRSATDSVINEEQHSSLNIGLNYACDVHNSFDGLIDEVILSPTSYPDGDGLCTEESSHECRMPRKRTIVTSSPQENCSPKKVKRNVFANAMGAPLSPIRRDAKCTPKPPGQVNAQSFHSETNHGPHSTGQCDSASHHSDIQTMPVSGHSEGTSMNHGSQTSSRRHCDVSDSFSELQSTSASAHFSDVSTNYGSESPSILNQCDSSGGHSVPCQSSSSTMNCDTLSANSEAQLHVNGSTTNHESQSVATDRSYFDASVSTNITDIDGRPFVDLQYLLSALSTENCRMVLSRLKKKSERFHLHGSTIFHPDKVPKFISLEAFIYHIFKAQTSYPVRKIQACLFHLLESHFREQSGSLASFSLVSDLDENRNIFLKLEDCYSLFNIRDDKRHRHFRNAAKFLGLAPETQIFLTGNRCTHINLRAVIGYLFAAVGSDRHRGVNAQMQTALDSIVDKLVVLVTELPVFVPNMPILSDVSLNSGITKVHGSDIKQFQRNPVNQSSSFLMGNRTNKPLQANKCTYNRTMSRRTKKQQDVFSSVAREIHKGGKESFKDGIVYSMQHPVPVSGNSTSGDKKNWNGSLTSQDLIDILARVPSTTETSVLEEHLKELARELYHVDARSVINMVDNCSSQKVMDQLRAIMPGVLASRTEVKDELAKLDKEFEALLRPTQTATGYRVDAGRFLKCLRYLYYFVPRDYQLWKIWGDARETGGKKCCSITISPLNNEVKLHGIKFHSPKEIWPLALFYGGDGRWNLEANTGSEGGQPGWLNNWIVSEQQSVNTFFLTGDSMFLDAIHGKHGELAPNSKTGFNLYCTDPAEEKHMTGAESGFRSEIPKTINRSVPNSLLPAIPLSRTVFCLDHATTRIVEKLIKLRVKSTIMLKGQCRQEAELRLHQLKLNMVNRMVSKGGRLAVNSDGSMTEKLSLNKRDAHALLLEHDPKLGTGRPLLEGVAMMSLMIPVDQPTQAALQWPPSVSEYELETEMWKNLSRAVFMLRDSDPLPLPKTGCEADSLSASDYSWGMQEQQIVQLTRHLDIFHKLFVLRYGGNELTPYMIKLIDFTTVFLRTLPVKSLMRFSTEGGEHLHYDDNCYYFQHTQRGGSYRTRDPLYTILLHRYRVLQYRLLEYSRDKCVEKAAAGRAFLKWVAQEMDSADPNPASGSSLLQPPIHNFIIVGRVPASVMKTLSCKTKDEFLVVLQQHRSRVVEVPHSQLPKCYETIRFVVIAQQASCECANPPAILLLACKRKWPIVSYLFCEAYVNDPFTSFDEFILDTSPLRRKHILSTAPQEKEGKDYFFKERGPVHPVTLYKKLNKKSKQKPKKRCLKGPGSGYARFVEQEMKHIHQDMPGACWKDINKAIAERWKRLSKDQREEFNNSAKQIFESSRSSKKQQNPNVPAYESTSV